MHLLDEETFDWVWRFGIPSGRNVDKFCGLETSSGVSGSPILTGAPGWADCRVEAQLDTGDRTIYLAEVLKARVERVAKPLMFQRMLELAPAERLQELNKGMEHDVEIDRAAILEWRGQVGRGDGH